MQAIEQIPPKGLAGALALHTIRILDEGHKAAAGSTQGWETRQEAHRQRRTVARGLRLIEAADIRTTVRQGQDGRWRWYAYREP
jgi:hypothetical protein